MNTTTPPVCREDTAPSKNSGIFWLRRRLSELAPVAEREGRSVWALFLSFEICKRFYHAGMDEFLMFRLFDLAPHALRGYLLAADITAMSKMYFDRGASPEDALLFRDKRRFNRAFQKFIRRDWLYGPESSPEDIRAFMDRHPVFVQKPAGGMQGHGVTVCRREELDPDSFAARCRREEVILEEPIRQHPAMSSLNPSSVNTVRVITARCGGRVMVAGAGLRVGGAGSFLDNFHSGGAAYPLDADTGVITGPGADLDQNRYLRHPSTGHIMPGFQVPHWEALLNTVLEAARLSPRIGWVGWDVAVLPDGVELVEGNEDPGTKVIQLGGRGVRWDLLAFVRSAREE